MFGAIFARWEEETAAAEDAATKTKTAEVAPAPSPVKVVKNPPAHRAAHRLDYFIQPAQQTKYYIYKQGTPDEFYIVLYSRPETDIQYYNLAVALRDNLCVDWLPAQLTVEEVEQLEKDDDFYSKFLTNPFPDIFSRSHIFYIHMLKPLVGDLLKQKKYIEANKDLHQEQKKELIDSLFSRFQAREKEVFADATKNLETEVSYYNSVMPRMGKAKKFFHELARVETLSKQTHQQQLQQFIDNLMLDAAIAGLPEAIREVKTTLHLFNNKDGIKIWLPKKFGSRSELEMLAMDLVKRPEGNYYRMEKPQLAQRLSDILIKLAADLSNAPSPAPIISQSEITELDRVWKKRSPTFYHSMQFWADSRAVAEVKVESKEVKAVADTEVELPKEIDPLFIAQQLLF